MLTTAIYVTVAMMCLALLLNLYRLLRGPTIVDRVTALDTMTINAVGLVLLLGIHTSSPLNFEMGLLIAMTGFIGTIAFCRYLLRGDIIE